MVAQGGQLETDETDVLRLTETLNGVNSFRPQSERDLQIVAICSLVKSVFTDYLPVLTYFAAMRFYAENSKGN